MNVDKFEYYPAKLIDINYLLLTIAIIAGLILAFCFLSVGTELATFLLLFPTFVVIFKPLWNFLKLVTHYDVMIKLRKIANSEGLIEQRNDVVNASVIFYYQETKKTIRITINPNGVRNSDSVYQLSTRISEIFGYTAFIDKEELTSVTYCMLKNTRDVHIDENEF